MSSDRKIKLIILMSIAFVLFNFPIVKILDKQGALVSIYYFFGVWFIIIVLTYLLVDLPKK